MKNKKLAVTAALLLVSLQLSATTSAIALTEKIVIKNPQSVKKFDSNYKSDLQSYKKQLAKIASAESEIVRGWASVSGTNYSTDEVMYNKLLTLVPKVNRFVMSLEAIQPADPKIFKAHQVYVEGWNLQFQGFTMVMAGLESQDYSQITQANSYLSRGRAKITSFTRMYKAL